MLNVDTHVLIIAACLLVICSYVFNVFSKKTGIPSVLLLLLSGIATREILFRNYTGIKIPDKIVEMFGILGLIMIVLEAGLDLQISRQKIKLIRNAFFSSLFILVISAVACSALLYFYLEENYLNCLIYSIPLSVVSSAIVIPSISHLQDNKKEFLVYETSFSDIIGIILFNYIIAGNLLHPANIAFFIGSVAFSILVSLIFSFLILLMLTAIKTNVRLYLALSVLILLYAGGKMLHLPALFIILLFGLIVSNWHLTIFERMHNAIPGRKVSDVLHLLHSLTAESSFLIRTFFFFIFGLTIDISLLFDIEVLLAGGLLVLVLFGIRYIYLRFFLKSHIFPELFFMPRGLITILLYYSIPETYRLSKFNAGILFFVILVTSVIMMVGSIAYGRPHLQAISDEEPISEGN